MLHERDNHELDIIPCHLLFDHGYIFLYLFVFVVVKDNFSLNFPIHSLSFVCIIHSGPFIVIILGDPDFFFHSLGLVCFRFLRLVPVVLL